MNNYTFRHIQQADWPQIVELSDKNFGTNYITSNELAKNFSKKHKNNSLCSYVLENPDYKIMGVRLTYAPGSWPQDLVSRSSNKWPITLDKLAYFKTLFLDSSLQGQGFGPKLTKLSFDSLIQLNTKAVVCHSWKESPNNSSERYLLNAGFKPLVEINNFWDYKEYDCVLCLPDKCKCTATEMIKLLEPTDTITA